MFAFAVICLGGTLIIGCGKKTARQVRPAFYHWKSNLQLTRVEKNYLDALGVGRLYVKCFDVDWDAATGQPVPLAVLEMDTAGLAGLQLVPTVFITNRCLLNLPVGGEPALAGRIFDKIAALWPSGLLPVGEVQFDCDWTAQTRDRFFGLLTAFKAQAASAPVPGFDSQLTISATIRLHQLKYPEQTGVPPADRGMLMCYNMGDLDSWETGNSVFDLSVLAEYLDGKTLASGYPLPLDVALPLYRWGGVYRDGRLVQLFNNLGPEMLRDTGRFHLLAANRYQVGQSTYLQGSYLYAGDKIRLETASEAVLEKAVPSLSSIAARPGCTVAFYHLDTSTVRLFPAVGTKRLLMGW